MPLPLSRSRPPTARAVAALALVMAASAASAESADFEVREGYLSASVRELVDSHGWSLVWSAGEDRMVSHAFTISNDSLEGALESLLAMYRGQFVADLYRGNRVVVVNTPPPRVDVELPGSVGNQAARQSAVGEPAPVESNLVDAGTETPMTVAYEGPAPDDSDGSISLPVTVNAEAADLSR
ncbi:MAG: TcpQ domain-containing protein [Gammaproteobacteria bacterium]|nr:TcpQ domain-containing protein [Gammaproteobacteria bacterium]